MLLILKNQFFFNKEINNTLSIIYVKNIPKRPISPPKGKSVLKNNAPNNVLKI